MKNRTEIPGVRRDARLAGKTGDAVEETGESGQLVAMERSASLKESATRSHVRVFVYTIHRCGELWCYTPGDRASQVTRGAKRKEKRTPVGGASVRATISFPSEMYQTLADIAHQKKVSLAWVVREATEQYIAGKWPLFKGKV